MSDKPEGYVFGRPTVFTQELADEICERIADGESLRSICKEESKPNKATVFRWLNANQDFSDQYTRAREEQAESFADEIVAIADDGKRDYVFDDGKFGVDTDHISRARLRVEARKWVASKLKPKRYGDKLDLNHGGSINTNVTSELTEAQIVARLAEIQAAKKPE